MHESRGRIKRGTGSRKRRYFFFCCSRIFAHLALAAARILAIPAADMRRLPGVLFVALFLLAQRARCAAAMRLRAAEDSVRRGLV